MPRYSASSGSPERTSRGAAPTYNNFVFDSPQHGYGRSSLTDSPYTGQPAKPSPSVPLYARTSHSGGPLAGAGQPPATPVRPDLLPPSQSPRPRFSGARPTSAMPVATAARQRELGRPISALVPTRHPLGSPSGAAAATDAPVGNGVLKSVCRHVHAEAMVLNRDKESLAEEWHQLMCSFDPDHPEYVATPIAKDVDSYTLAYAILLIREGIFNPGKWDAGCNMCTLHRSINHDLLNSLLERAVRCMRQEGRMRPMSATPDFLNMTEDDRIALLTKIYGGGGGKSPRKPKLRLFNLAPVPNFPDEDDDFFGKPPPKASRATKSPTRRPPPRPVTAPPPALPRTPSSASRKSVTAKQAPQVEIMSTSEATPVEFDDTAGGGEEPPAEAEPAPEARPVLAEQGTQTDSWTGTDGVQTHGVQTDGVQTDSVQTGEETQTDASQTATEGQEMQTDASQTGTEGQEMQTDGVQTDGDGMQTEGTQAEEGVQAGGQGDRPATQDAAAQTDALPAQSIGVDTDGLDPMAGVQVVTQEEVTQWDPQDFTPVETKDQLLSRLGFPGADPDKVAAFAGQAAKALEEMVGMAEALPGTEEAAAAQAAALSDAAGAMKPGAAAGTDGAQGDEEGDGEGLPAEVGQLHEALGKTHEQLDRQAAGALLVGSEVPGEPGSGSDSPLEVPVFVTTISAKRPAGEGGLAEEPSRFLISDVPAPDLSKEASDDRVFRAGKGKVTKRGTDILEGKAKAKLPGSDSCIFVAGYAGSPKEAPKTAKRRRPGKHATNRVGRHASSRFRRAIGAVEEPTGSWVDSVPLYTFTLGAGVGGASQEDLARVLEALAQAQARAQNLGASKVLAGGVDGHMPAATDDPLVESGLPSVVPLLQQLQIAGTYLVRSLATAVAACMGPNSSPPGPDGAGDEKPSAAALLAPSLADAGAACGSVQRLLRVLADKARLAQRMLSYRPRKGPDSAALRLVGELAGIAEGRYSALLAFAGPVLQHLETLSHTWSPTGSVSKDQSREAMVVVRELFDCMHTFSQDLVAGLGQTYMVQDKGAAPLGMQGATKGGALETTAAMAANLSALADAVDRLYGARPRKQQPGPETSATPDLAEGDLSGQEIGAGSEEGAETQGATQKVSAGEAQSAEVSAAQLVKAGERSRPASAARSPTASAAQSRPASAARSAAAGPSRPGSSAKSGAGIQSRPASAAQSATAAQSRPASAAQSTAAATQSRPTSAAQSRPASAAQSAAAATQSRPTSAAQSQPASAAQSRPASAAQSAAAATQSRPTSAAQSRPASATQSAAAATQSRPTSAAQSRPASAAQSAAAAQSRPTSAAQSVAAVQSRPTSAAQSSASVAQSRPASAARSSAGELSAAEPLPSAASEDRLQASGSTTEHLSAELEVAGATEAPLDHSSSGLEGAGTPQELSSADQQEVGASAQQSVAELAAGPEASGSLELGQQAGAGSETGPTDWAMVGGEPGAEAEAEGSSMFVPGPGPIGESVEDQDSEVQMQYTASVSAVPPPSSGKGAPEPRVSQADPRTEEEIKVEAEAVVAQVMAGVAINLTDTIAQAVARAVAGAVDYDVLPRQEVVLSPTGGVSAEPSRSQAVASRAASAEAPAADLEAEAEPQPEPEREEEEPTSEREAEPEPEAEPAQEEVSEPQASQELEPEAEQGQEEQEPVSELKPGQEPRLQPEPEPETEPRTDSAAPVVAAADAPVAADLGEVEGDGPATAAEQPSAVEAAADVEAEDEGDRMLHAAALLPVLQGCLLNAGTLLNSWASVYNKTWDVARAHALHESIESMGMPSYQDLLQQLEEARRQLQERDEQLAEAQKAAEDRDAELEATRAELEATRAELAETKEQLAGRDKELEEARQQLEELRKQLEEALAKVSELEARVKELEAELEQVKKELDEAKEAAACKDCPTLKDRLKSKEEMSSDLEAKLAEALRKLEELQKKVEELEAALEEAKKPEPEKVDEKCCGCF